MGFVEAIRTCFEKFADFEGRARRSEFWFFELFFFVVILVPAIFATLSGMSLSRAPGIILLLLWALAALAMFLPNLAVNVRRLHDTDSSGWWYLVFLVPYVGKLIMVVWCCLRGTTGPNRFGPDPLGPDSDLGAAFD